MMPKKKMGGGMMQKPMGYRSGTYGQSTWL